MRYYDMEHASVVDDVGTLIGYLFAIQLCYYIVYLFSRERNSNLQWGDRVAVDYGGRLPNQCRDDIQ